MLTPDTRHLQFLTTCCQKKAPKGLIAAEAQALYSLQSSNYYITCILKNNPGLEDIYNG